MQSGPTLSQGPACNGCAPAERRLDSRIGGENAAFNARAHNTAMITIYHNPACATSRNTLGLLRNSGAEPSVIEYLKTPPSHEELVALLAAMRISARSLLRTKDTPYDELRLDDPKWSEAELIEFMLTHPILINRPIVVTPLGAALCRPSELVLELLPAPQRGGFRKEDGALLIDSQGRRVANSC
jgi:arsenate reductase